jgi:hypothetical protein
MSLENLLQQYNKNRQRNVSATGGLKIFSESYLNKYDALYNKYKDNQNFNRKMWQESFDRGDQDTYIAFLEQNKDTTLNDKYYDPMYYDYEAMLVELSLPFMDNTKFTKRTKEVLDPITNKIIQEDIGEMTDYQFAQYQLEQIHSIRENELTRQFEQWRKDQMSWMQKTLNNIAGSGMELLEGTATGITGVIDAVVSPFAATVGAIKGENWLDAFVDYFADDSLTAFEKRTIRSALDEYERLNTTLVDIDGNPIGIGKYITGLLNSIGMMIPAIAAGIATGGASWVGASVFNAALFTGYMYDNATNPDTVASPSWLKISNALINTTIEAVIEYGLGQLLGGTIQNTALGLAGKSGLKSFKGLSKGAGLVYLLKSAGQEGLEEFLQDFSTNLSDQFTSTIYEGYANTGVTFQTLIDSFILGAISSLVMSGGQIGIDNIKTDIANKKIEKKTGIKGAAELYIEKDGKLERVRGAKKLYFSSIISDFKDTAEKLAKNKIKNSNDIKVAQELYSAISILSQLYSSFSDERMKNAENLLNRVIAKENVDIAKYKEENKTAKNDTDEQIRNTVALKRQEEIKSFAETMLKDITSMVNDAQKRELTRISNATKNVENVLKYNGVTKVEKVITKDVDPEIREINKVLQKKQDEYLKDYDFLFVTDGHIGIEEDGMLYISESWLENYSVSDVYKFLAQNRILKTILQVKELQPMLKELTNFVEKFTKLKNISTEDALMHFLFNESVFQAFLLSQNGKNVFEFKDFIFRIHDTIKRAGDIKIDTDKRFNEKTKELRKAYLNKVYEDIKNTMRKPILKAIFNWNVDPVSVGADSVLTDADKDAIQQYQARKNIFNQAKTGKISSEFEYLVKDILREGKFSDEEKEYIEKGLKDDASQYDRLNSLGMLECADKLVTTYSFQISRLKGIGNYIVSLLDNAINTANTYDVVNTFNKLISFISNKEYFDDLNLLTSAENYMIIERISKEANSIKGADTNILVSFFKKYRDTISKVYNTLHSRLEIAAKHSVTLPLEAFNIEDNNDEVIAQSIQFKADKIEEFKNLYGISVEDMMTGNTKTMTYAQIERLQQDMKILDTTDYVYFAQTKLESLLGGDYIVFPQYNTYEQGSEEISTVLEVVGFRIAKKIDSDKVLIKPLKNTDNKIKNNNNLLDMFVKSPNSKYDKLSLESNYEPLSLKDIVNITLENDWKVYIVKNNIDDESNLAYTDTENKIIVLRENDNDLYNNFIHELNHVVQFEYNLPSGYNISRAYNNTSFLQYIYDNFKPLLKYMLRRTMISENISIYNEKTGKSEYFTVDDKVDINKLNVNFKELLAYISYVLIDGELAAQRFMHNGSPVHGFINFMDDNFVLTPDKKNILTYKSNKKVFFNNKELPVYKGTFIDVYDKITKTNTNDMKISANQKIPKVFAENSFAREFELVYNTRKSLYQNGYMNINTRNTYHSKLKSKNAIDIINSLVKEDIIITPKNINEIILNPKKFLSKEMIKKCNGNLSEGNVFYRLKEYVEDTFDSISIDRDRNTHEYILVNDNAFDDLMNTTIKEKANDITGTDIASEYENKTVGLATFYKLLALNKLNLQYSTKILISREGKSELRVDNEKKTATIYINNTTYENGKSRYRTNAEILDGLNHEFRHLMQEANNFETGFTANINITSDMLIDIKKYAPEIFENKTLIEDAKLVGRKDVDIFIAQRFIYYLIGGEKNAYGIRSSLLNIKPAYVTYEAGKYTIFMPWYNAETGEGRYIVNETKADKIAKMPSVDKKHKYDSVKIDETGKRIYKYKKNRYVSKKKAENTNLMYWFKNKKPGEQIFIDPDLQDFIIATTGNEDKISPVVMNAIYKKVLTKQSLFKWFRNAKLEDINEYTFNLLNEYMFKNEYIKNMKQLDLLTFRDPGFYWATALVLRENHLELESLISQNSVEKFLEFMNSLEGTKWEEKILTLQAKSFNWYKTYDGVKEYTIDVNDNYMRVFIMQYFDGTLAGAFYMANAYRKYIKRLNLEREQRETSSDSNIINQKGEKEKTIGDYISDDDLAKMEANVDNSIANDIISLYNMRDEYNEDRLYNMFTELLFLKEKDLIDKMYKKLKLSQEQIKQIEDWFNEDNDPLDDYSEFSKQIRKREKLDKEGKLDTRRKNNLRKLQEVKKGLVEIKQAVEDYDNELRNVNEDTLIARYNYIKDAELMGTEIPANVFEERHKDSREGIASRIKSLGTRFSNLILQGKISFSNLPDNVQEMFELTKRKNKKTGKEELFYKIKPEVYSVGRGPSKLPGVIKGRNFYEGKRDLANEKQTQKHDTTRIKENRELLENTMSSTLDFIKNREMVVEESRKANNRAQKRIRSLEKIINENMNRKAKRTDTTFTVKSTRRVNDTPNHFTIQSDIPMPDILRRLFNVSFEDMANTEVQFASLDKEGNIYTKEKSEFDSRLNHEVTNWTVFYEANRSILLSLTREDVLNIIEFFRYGNAISFDGAPTNKMVAFEIYLLGYFYDIAKRNAANWNFSDNEIELLRKLYEDKASRVGSGLNAVSQMLKVINPFRRIQQQMLDDYDISEDELQPLFDTIDNIQKEKDDIKRKELEKQLAKELSNLDKLMYNSDTTRRGLDKAKLKDLLTAINNLRNEKNTNRRGILKNRLREVLQGIERDVFADNYKDFTKIWYKKLVDIIDNIDNETDNEKRKILENDLKSHIKRISNLMSDTIRPRNYGYGKRWWQKLKAFRFVSMLSSPVTWVRNVTSNIILDNFNNASDAIANLVFNKKGYSKGQWDLSHTIVSEDAKNFIDKYIKNDPMFDYIFEGQTKHDDRRKILDTKRTLFVNMIVSSLEQRYAANHRFDTKVANRIAAFVSERISDKRFIKKVTEKYFGKLLTIESAKGKINLNSGLSNEILELFAESVILGNNDFMHKRSFLAEAMSKIKQSNPKAYEVLSFWQPFLNSSFNWFTEMLKYSPIGLINSVVRMAKLEKRITDIDTRRARGENIPNTRMTEYLVRRDVGKGIIGLTMTILGLLLGAFGIIRLDEDDEGKFYLYAGDVKIDISSLFGTSSLLVGASLVQIWNEDTRSKYDLVDILRMTTTQLSEGFILNDMLARHKYDEGTWDFLLTEGESVMRSFVPQFIQYIIRLTNNEKIRYNSGITGVWERWLNSFIATQPLGSRKVDPYTGEIESKYAIPVIGELISMSGMKFYWSTISDEEKLAREYGLNKKELDAELTINGNKVYLSDVEKLNEYYGKLNKKTLLALQSQSHYVEMPNGTYQTLPWNKLSDEQCKRVINRQMTENANIAKVYIWTQVMNKKYYASESMWQALRKQNVIKNVYRGDKGFVE